MKITLTKPDVAEKPLILAVDDQEDNLVLLVEVLKAFNCNVISAADGNSALSSAQKYLPDLILLDIMLPDIHGLEVVSQLKQNQNTQNIPIVAVTGLARNEDRDRLLAIGCADYISKPYILPELEALISAYVPAVATLT